MTKMINIDALVSRPRAVIQIGDAQHEVRELSVQDSIDVTRATEKLQKEYTLSGELELLVNIMRRVIPSIGDETLRNLPVSVLKEIHDKVMELDSVTVTDAGNPTAGS